MRLEERGGNPAKSAGVLTQMWVFLQEWYGRDAGGKMQDELQETLLAIHGQTPKLCRIYKYRKRELYKIVEIPQEMRIMKTVRKR